MASSLNGVRTTLFAAVRALAFMPLLYAIAAISPGASPAAVSPSFGDLVLNANRAAGLYGDPAAAAAHWHRQHGLDCGEVAVADVVGEITGRQPTEQQVDELAQSIPSTTHSGPIWQPSGFTDVRDLPILLKHYGIGVKSTQTDLDTLKRTLGMGGKIIAVVNAEILWNRPGDRKWGDHFVVVTGIDSRSGVVHLNDSGISSGRDEHVPIAVFEQAWATNFHSALITR
ncbi:C39 family peptidase [Mycobacterium sp.]|uniref:C39 family peptidase n=1 Tax=Mycobacterium sp. TaxID=1785 RepID=UPI0025E5B9A2|nr:C39 family peptidase [Mycobacterium sp.]